MVVTAQEWSQQYEALKKRIQNQRINGSVMTGEEVKALINSISILESQLKSMSASPIQYEIAASEIARRTVLLENLKRQMSSPAVGGSVLVSTAPVGEIGSSSGRTGTYNPLATSDKGLVQRQKDIMQLQDEMVLDIESGVDRLHGKALAIGEESKMHVRLLDDLDGNVEIATAALQAESKHAERIKDKAQVCYMYICIVVEVLIIMLLLIITLMG